MKEYRNNNKEKAKLRWRNYYEINKENLKIKRRHYLQNNRDTTRNAVKKYNIKNCDTLFKIRKEYRKTNEIKIKNYMREYNKKRRSNPEHKLRIILSGITYNAFKRRGYLKNSNTHKILGAEFNFVKAYIERQFKKGMNWSNYGDWHIDHKIPLKTANTDNELIDLCHYTNLQPLWAVDNLKKSSKILPIQTTLII